MLQYAMSKAGPMPWTEAEMYFSKVYETRFGIYNHYAKPLTGPRPLASVAMHPAEDYSYGSVLEQSMDRFVEYGIGDLFDISYLDFMSLPTTVTKAFLASAKRQKEKKANQIDQVEADIKDAISGKR